MDAQLQKPDIWIVLDNSTSSSEDWSVSTQCPFVSYQHIEEPKPIGWLRNKCLELALESGADYIVFWDDDDYYPPTRISSGVSALESNPSADISGSSKMYLLLTKENVLMTTGPFHDKHATAATWTIRRRYAENNQFDSTKQKGEEVTFTKDWKATMVQVPSEQVIVVMGHSRNTVDKSDLLARPQVYNAAIVNRDNGKMVVRSKWPIPWTLFRNTFYSPQQ